MLSVGFHDIEVQLFPPKVTNVGQVWVPMPPVGLKDLSAGVKELRGTSTHSHLFPELSQLTLWKVQSRRL